MLHADAVELVVDALHPLLDLTLHHVLGHGLGLQEHFFTFPITSGHVHLSHSPRPRLPGAILLHFRAATHLQLGDLLDARQVRDVIGTTSQLADEVLQL